MLKLVIILHLCSNYLYYSDGVW